MSASKNTKNGGPRRTYDVRLDEGPAEVLDTLQGADYENLRDVLRAMRQEPRRPGGKRIAKLPDGTYRVRQGNHRIFFDVDDGERLVLVVEISRRNEGTYKKRQRPRRR